MDFDQYQEQAMTTNMRPKLFTEDQTRNLVARAYTRGMGAALEDAYEWADSDLSKEASEFNALLYPLLGLLEEAGELAGKVKKVIRDQNGVLNDDNRSALHLESGDALWYLSAIADALGTDFSEVAQSNLDKLADRARRGVLQGSGDLR